MSLHRVSRGLERRSSATLLGSLHTVLLLIPKSKIFHSSLTQEWNYLSYRGNWFCSDKQRLPPWPYEKISENMYILINHLHTWHRPLCPGPSNEIPIFSISMNWPRACFVKWFILCKWKESKGYPWLLRRYDMWIINLTSPDRAGQMKVAGWMWIKTWAWKGRGACVRYVSDL
jgi:hypothetical protein